MPRSIAAGSESSSSRRRGRNTVLTGNRLVLAPDTIVNWGLNVKPMPAVDLTLDIKHVGEAVGDESNTFLIDAYTLVDAGGHMAARALPRHALRAQPVRHEYYFDVNSESADPGPPRQVLLSTTIRIR